MIGVVIPAIFKISKNNGNSNIEYILFEIVIGMKHKMEDQRILCVTQDKRQIFILLNRVKTNIFRKYVGSHLNSQK